MKRGAFLLLTFAVIAGCMLFLTGMGSPAQAQQGCINFAALAQATLPTSTPLAADDTWGGPVVAYLGSELLQGAMSGNDGMETWRGPKMYVGQGKGGVYRLCFAAPCYATSDSFTYEVATAIFPAPPGLNGIAAYSAHPARIVSGGGRFQAASGALNVTGPALSWSTDGGTTWYGRWNVVLSGSICGVQSK